MRPLHLRIQAFGSYPEAEQVDFRALAELGLFCVTGPTGSGKSTIFDAITFALFGEVAGDRQVRDMRSQHAASGTLTEVSFEFEVDGRRYRVTRAPTQDQPKSRGTGTTVRGATASLDEWVDGQWQGVAGQATAVTARCVDIVGLSAEQFQQVVLLPQGAFSDFLLAKTADRQELLRKLFGSQLYVRAVEAMKGEYERLHDLVQAVDADAGRHRLNAVAAARQMAELLDVEAPAPSAPLADDADETASEAVATALEPARLSLAARADTGRQAASQARHAATGAAEASRRFDQAEALAGEQTTLREREAAVRADTARVDAARRAGPVMAASVAARAAAATHEAASARQAELVDRLRAGAAELGIDIGATPASAGTALAQCRAGLHTAAALLEAVDTAAALARAAAHELDAAAAEAARCAADHERLRHELDLAERQRAVAAAAAAGVEAARRDAAAATDRHAQRLALDATLDSLRSAREAADTAAATETRLLARFIGDAAPRLAAALVDGQACPVCGSVEHPAPAPSRSGDDAVDPAALDAARRASDSARGAVERLIERVTTLRTSLGDAAQLAVGLVERAAADSAATLAAAEAAERDRDALTIRCGEYRNAVAEAAEVLAAASTVEVTHRARTVAAHDDHRAAAERGAGIDAEHVRASLALVDRLVPTVDTWSDVSAQVAAADGARATDAQRLVEALAASGFADVGSAAAVALDDAAIERLVADIAAHEARSAAVDAQLAQLEALGVPADRPDSEAAERAATVLEHQATSLERTRALVDQRHDDLIRAVAAARSITADSADLRRRCDVVEHVRAVCNGTAGRRIGLETWVLAAELDRVTASATEHLQRMSNGRYALVRTADAERGGQRTGLEIAVFDAHTGQSRPPVSLSGGERFQASLALALGLADVVSQGGTGSGRVFEALFVDEGFGSLDPEALDDAIEALGHLQASGRMVGAITHVEAMKAQVPTGIEVRRRPAGSGSTIVQPGVRR
jgi:exonuclease SbcC